MKKKSYGHIFLFPGLFETKHTPLFVNATVYFQGIGYKCDTIDIFDKACPFGRNRVDFIQKEIQKVILSFSRNAYRIAIAHSMGAFFALANSNLFEKIILWDPSLHPKEIFDCVKKTRKQGEYLYPIMGYEILLHREFLASLNQFQDIQILLSLVPKHKLFIIAADGMSEKMIQEKYLPFLHDSKSSFRTLPLADHNFSMPVHQKKLFKYSNKVLMSNRIIQKQLNK